MTVAAKPARRATPRANRKFRKPRYYHELTGKSVDWIRARITDGSLHAYNFSEGGRADWYIREDDWESFLATKVNVAPPPKPARRRRRSQEVTEYY